MRDSVLPVGTAAGTGTTVEDTAGWTTQVLGETLELVGIRIERCLLLQSEHSKNTGVIWPCYQVREVLVLSGFVCSIHPFFSSVF